MAHHPVWVHIVEVVLHVLDVQQAHSQGIHHGVAGAADIEEPGVDDVVDEAVEAGKLPVPHGVRQNQLAGVQGVHRLAGGEELHQGLQIVHIEVGPLQRVQSAGKYVVGEDAVFALRQDAVPVLQAVPHLAALHLVDGLRVEGVAGHDGHLDGPLAVAELGDVVHGGKEGEAIHGLCGFFLRLRRLHLADMPLQHLGDPLDRRPLAFFLHQELDHKHPARTDGGVHLIQRRLFFRGALRLFLRLFLFEKSHIVPPILKNRAQKRPVLGVRISPPWGRRPPGLCRRRCRCT